MRMPRLRRAVVAFFFVYAAAATWPVALLVAVGLGVVLSTSALLLEEMSFHIYPGLRSTLILFSVAILENFGYRQLNSVWRFIGLVRWLGGGQAKWGEMRRGGAWSRTRD